MSSVSEPNALIVCFGKTMDELCATVIAEIALQEPEHRLQFVMHDWISPDQLAKASVFWVVDRATEVAEMAPALQYGIPLLVPQASGALQELCLTSNGLFYQNEAEAMSSLIRLVTRP